MEQFAHSDLDDPSKYGVVVTKSNSTAIDRFVEKPATFVSNKINAGIYMFNPSILERIEEVPTSIETEVFPIMAAQSQLHAMEMQGFWMDVGQPRDFLTGTSLYLTSVHKKTPQLLTTGKDFLGNVLVDPSAQIGKDCKIGPNVVIGPNVIIGDGVRLNSCVILDGTHIRDHAWIINSIIGWRSTIGRWTRVEGVTVTGEDVHVSDEIYLNGARILPHKSVAMNVPEPKIIL